MIQNVLFGTIIDTIEDFVGPYITQGLGLLTGLSVWIQAAILLVAAIFILIGFFVFLKKSFKLIIVLAILGGIGYLLYNQGIFDNILGGLFPPATTTTAAFIQILRALPL
jgi:hypothetical protein